MFSVPGSFFLNTNHWEYFGIPTAESFLNAMHRISSNDDEFCDNNFDLDTFYSFYFRTSWRIDTNNILRMRASHWSKIKKLYLASWLMNTSPLELLDSAFVWLRSIVKSEWISRISVKQKWALNHIFTEYRSVFYLLVSNIKPCSGESEKCEKICKVWKAKLTCCNYTQVAHLKLSKTTYSSKL